MSGPDETFLDLSLSRSTVHRAGALRTDPEAITAALSDPDTRVLTLRAGTAAVVGGDRPRLALRPPRPEDAPQPWLLGVEDGRTYLAVEDEVDAADETEPPGVSGGPEGAEIVWRGLREVGADLDDRDAGLLTSATALAEWHHRHQHCPRCGARTVIEQGGWVRVCPTDGSQHHPRTDPAVIMAVTDVDDRLLLGSGVAWPEHRVSVLAGFVEAGESLEAAVIREVQEEVGIAVTNLVYRGNQPWPFPASLMLGFRAVATSTDLVVDPVELREAQWYDRERLAREVASGEVTLPMRVSIARRLIEEWFGGRLREPREPR
ncbi:NAD(+) diphosphatase [Ornithinimicrobium sufpigmenti]|uniref:NAD(+) diphosphatase n=1 Tax=Ornithinimicrobium sufpigmenti TaxID=2508882 RepID=UPI001EDF5E89|nr:MULTISPECIES: NAD(+) diphosphatase [unclassified Ornithinimicrobium]